MSTLRLKPFFETIYRLRNNEELVLFRKMLSIEKDDAQDVADFLSAEWENEVLEYPQPAPEFDEQAALWAAQTVYYAAQLLLYREHSHEDLPALLPPYGRRSDAGAMLSADLCLRMLPTILTPLRAINPDDPLIQIIEQHLQVWHYSAVGFGLPITAPDFGPFLQNPCAVQLYADRVIERKDIKMAAQPELSIIIAASMGDFRQYFWKE